MKTRRPQMAKAPTRSGICQLLRTNAIMARTAATRKEVLTHMGFFCFTCDSTFLYFFGENKKRGTIHKLRMSLKH